MSGLPFKEITVSHRWADQLFPNHELSARREAWICRGRHALPHKGLGKCGWGGFHSRGHARTESWGINSTSIGRLESDWTSLPVCRAQQRACGMSGWVGPQCWWSWQEGEASAGTRAWGVILHPAWLCFSVPTSSPWEKYWVEVIYEEQRRKQKEKKTVKAEWASGLLIWAPGARSHWNLLGEQRPRL